MRSTNRLLLSAIILLLSVCIASQSMFEEERQCVENPTGAVSLNVDVRGVAGPEGPRGRRGPKGINGEKGNRGEKGKPGDTQLNEEELDRVSDEVIEKLNMSIIAELIECNKELKKRVKDLELFHPATLCNITSPNWRRIAYFDTTQGHSCPEGLPTHTNSSTQQTACGKITGTCSALMYSAGGSYTHVCGKLRGYQYYQPLGVNIFQYTGIRGQGEKCVDGWTISTGTSGQHLWSYVAGLSETRHQIQYHCPCSSSSFNSSWVPPFLRQDHYYCESGVVDVASQEHVYWADPLWDGEGCITSGNNCCQRHGWFHRQLDQTSEDIEVNCCDDRFPLGAALLDQLEIWVM